MGLSAIPKATLEADLAILQGDLKPSNSGQSGKSDKSNGKSGASNPSESSGGTQSADSAPLTQDEIGDLSDPSTLQQDAGSMSQTQIQNMITQIQAQIQADNAADALAQQTGDMAGTGDTGDSGDTGGTGDTGGSGDAGSPSPTPSPSAGSPGGSPETPSESPAATPAAAPATNDGPAGTTSPAASPTTSSAPAASASVPASSNHATGNTPDSSSIYNPSNPTVTQTLSQLNPNVGGDKAAAAAISRMGLPYQWGGTNPQTGMDCSGLTQWAAAQGGANIPRTSEDQEASEPTVNGATNSNGTVNASAMKPGDLIIMDGGGHVGMYVGNGEMMQEPETGDSAKMTPISQIGAAGNVSAVSVVRPNYP